MDLALLGVSIIVGAALLFDFVNGFHDAANSVATVVSTRVLTPLQAVVWAAFFNLVAVFIFGLHVATTIGKGIVAPEVMVPTAVLAALIGAIAWDLITWYFGLPSSSSHALIGGIVGAAIASAGVGSIIVPGLVKPVIFIVVSPVIGFFMAFLFIIAVTWTFRAYSHYQVDWIFRRLQLVSAAAYSLGHGTNDAQKTMGIIAVLLYTTGYLGPQFYVPFWVVVAAGVAMALGTLTGGWRIVRTMGMRLTKLYPYHGFCAETAGAISLLGTALAGIPVSTTHTISGAIMGVGSIHRVSAVRWGVAGMMVWAWILTIPASGAIAAGSFYILQFFAG